MYREQRIVTSCPVRFPRLDRTVDAVSEDLSRRGVFVRTDELLPVGDIVTLEISLPAVDDTVRVISRVAHLLSPSAARALGRRPGMGFEFLEQDNEGREQLQRYLEDLLEEVTPPPEELPAAARVLVADASERLLERLTSTLANDGFSVRTVRNGAEAYSACMDQVPDVVLVSASMPVMDGWTFTRQLLGRPGLADVPIVLMSEDGSDITRLEAYRLGVRDFIHMPFTDEEVCIRLRRLALAQRHSERVVLRGSLGEIGLPTLLSLLGFERKSGILVLLRNDEAARLFVAAGHVVKVEGPRADGSPRERLFQVLDWTHGNFEFAACEVSGSDDIGMPTSSLLLEHARLCDESMRPGDGDGERAGGDLDFDGI